MEQGNGGDIEIIELQNDYNTQGEYPEERKPALYLRFKKNII